MGAKNIIITFKKGDFAGRASFSYTGVQFGFDEQKMEIVAENKSNAAWKRSYFLLKDIETVIDIDTAEQYWPFVND